jgi:transcriptional regulator of met regulon
MKKFIALWFVLKVGVTTLIAMDKSIIVVPADALLPLQNIIERVRVRVPNTRHNTHRKMILQTFIHALTSLTLLETNNEKLEIIKGVLNNAKINFTAEKFDGERMAMLAQQVLEVVASENFDFGQDSTAVNQMRDVFLDNEFDLDNGIIAHPPGENRIDTEELIKLRREFAALLTQIAPIQLILLSRKNTNISLEQVRLIKAIGETAVEVVDNIIAIDSNLTGEEKCQLMKLGEQIQDNLQLVARQSRRRVFTSDGVDQCVVFVVKQLQEIACLLAVEQK